MEISLTEKQKSVGEGEVYERLSTLLMNGMKQEIKAGELGLFGLGPCGFFLRLNIWGIEKNC